MSETPKSLEEQPVFTLLYRRAELMPDGSIGAVFIGEFGGDRSKDLRLTVAQAQTLADQITQKVGNHSSLPPKTAPGSAHDWESDEYGARFCSWCKANWSLYASDRECPAARQAASPEKDTFDAMEIAFLNETITTLQRELEAARTAAPTLTAVGQGELPERVDD